MEDWKLAIFAGLSVFIVIVGVGTFAWYMKNNVKYIS